MDVFNNTTFGFDNSSVIQANRSRYHRYDLRSLTYIIYALYAIILLLGPCFNLWMLCSLVTSSAMRSQLRNKILCIVLLNNLIKSTIVCVSEIVSYTAHFEYGMFYDCRFTTAITIMRYSIMWIEDWYVIILLIQYFLVLLNFNLANILSARLLKIGTVMLLLGPWLITVVVAPFVLRYHSHQKYGPLKNGCLFKTSESYRSLVIFGCVVPCPIMLSLLVAIVVTFYRRKSKSRPMSISIIGPDARIDDVRMYIAICLLSVLTQSFSIPKVIKGMEFLSAKDRIYYNWITRQLLDTRVIFLPLCFMFLEDIRHRIKTWRPWNHSDEDLIVRFRRDERKDDN